MNYKLRILAILLLSSGISQPAHAGLWDYVRNSALVTKIFGKPAAQNYTQQTRLPVVAAQPSFWARIFNFYSWMNYGESSQEQSVPQTAAQPAAPTELVEPTVPREASDRLLNYFNKLQIEYQAKQQKELQQQEKDDKRISDLIDEKITLKQNLEKAEQAAEKNKKGWEALGNYTSKKEAELAEAESAALRLKEAVTKHTNQLSHAETEKEILLAVIQTAQNENDQYVREKNNAIKELEKFKKEVETGEKLTKSEFEKSEQHVLKLKKELEDISFNNEHSQAQLILEKSKLMRIESELERAILERDGYSKLVTDLRTRNESLESQLKQLLKLQSSPDLKTMKSDLEAEKKAHANTVTDFAAFKQQAAIAKEIFDHQLKQKDEEHLRERERARSAAQQEAREQIEGLTKTISRLTQEIENLNVKSSSSIAELTAKKAALERKGIEYLEALNAKTQLLKQVQESTSAAIAEAKADNTKLIQELESSKKQMATAEDVNLDLNQFLNGKNTELQQLEFARAKMQELLKQKESNLELLMQKLLREEEQKKETLKFATSFEHNMLSVLDRFKAMNSRLDRMNGTLDHNQKCLKKLRQQLSHPTQAAYPQLPVTVIPIKSEEQLTLTELERRQLASASGNEGISAELLQSKFASQALNRSVTEELADSFSPSSPASPSSSPDIVPNGSESIYDHLQVDPIHYMEKAKKGRTYLEQIQQGNFAAQLLPKNQDEHLEIIEKILYRLHQKASYTGQGFLEGTYVIQDTENFDLYNTIYSYVKKVNPQVTGTAQDPLSHVSLNAYAYPRDASHFVENKNKHPFYGIDMRRKDKTTFTLPNNHGHLLVGFVDYQKRLIFLKPEHKGIYILDGWFGHCGEFITAQARKNNLIGKSIRTVAGLFGYEIWTDDNPLYHKERIPAEFIKQFALLLAQEEALTDEQKAQLKAEASLLGIQKLADPQIAQSPAFQQMKAAYQARYDNLENRRGREVHFTLPQLITLEQ